MSRFVLPGGMKEQKNFLRRINIVTNKLCVLLLGLGFTAALIVSDGPCHATLGKAAGSIASDQRALVAVKPSPTFRNGYTIQEVSSDAVAVREYISSEGIVFAVAWQGLIHPDLTPLLGSYAAEYEISLRQTPPKPGRRHLQVKTNNVIVEKWGHMRNLQGRAYIPALLPPGVSIDEIQ